MVMDIAARVLIKLEVVTVQKYSPESLSSTDLSIAVLLYSVWEIATDDVAFISLSLDPSGPLQIVLTDIGITSKKDELN